MGPKRYAMVVMTPTQVAVVPGAGGSRQHCGDARGRGVSRKRQAFERYHHQFPFKIHGQRKLTPTLHIFLECV